MLLRHGAEMIVHVPEELAIDDESLNGRTEREADDTGKEVIHAERIAKRHRSPVRTVPLAS